MKKRNAFTLAEVLITLGIIGIVAAMTMPTLIQKNNNRVVETRLMKFYSAINQAVKMAEVYYGDKKYWWEDVKGATIDKDGNPVPGTSDVEKWFRKYLAPYMKITKMENGKENFVVYFADGSAIRTRRKDSSRDWDFFPGNIQRCVKKQENTVDAQESVGRCAFPFIFKPNSDEEFWKYHYNKGFEPYKHNWDGNIDMLYNDSAYGCNSKSSSWRQYCTAIIQLNGWKIPDNYPFKVSY